MKSLWQRLASPFRKPVDSVPDVVDNRPPHEQWPEIRHWQQDDVFDCCSSRYVREPAPELIALTPDGYAYCWANCLRDNKVKIPIGLLIGRNKTLRTRLIDSEISESSEYMELIRQFNIAYAELEARDKANGVVNAN